MCRSAFASSSLPAVSSVLFLADAGEHVLQLSPLRRVIEHVAERQHGNFVARREGGDLGKPASVVAVIEAGGAEPHMAGEGFGESGERCSTPFEGGLDMAEGSQALGTASASPTRVGERSHAEVGSCSRPPARG